MKINKYEKISKELAEALKGLAEMVIIGNYDAVERHVRLTHAAKVLKKWKKINQ